jgi:hypothetical protein
MKNNLILFCILISGYSAFCQNAILDEYYVKTSKSGKFLTLVNDKPVEQTQLYEEEISSTNDGGTAIFLKPEKPSGAFRTTTDNSVNSSNVKVYPNPSGGSFTIETNIEDTQYVSLTFIMYDMNGKVVKKIDNVKAQDNIFVPKENIVSGLYFYSLVSGSRVVYTGKINVVE